MRLDKGSAEAYQQVSHLFWAHGLGAQSANFDWTVRTNQPADWAGVKMKKSRKLAEDPAT